MAAPTFVQEVESPFDASSPNVTPAFDALNGDVLAAFGISGDNTTTITISNSGTALTWTQRQVTNTGSRCKVYCWTAPLTEDRTGLTVSFTLGGNSNFIGGTVQTWRSHGGIGASAQAQAADNAPTVTVTTTGANSAVACACGDWEAGDGAARTWRAVNSITPTSGNGLERLYFRDAAQLTAYSAYWNDAGVAGAKSVGLTAPNSQDYTIIGIEILGGAGGAPIEVDLTPATETDTAQALTVTKPILKTLGIGLEADTAGALRAPRITAAAETDIGQSLNVDKIVTPAPALEVDQAQPVTFTKTILTTLGTVGETDAAQALTVTKPIIKAVAAAVEIDSAQLLIGLKQTTLALTVETDTATAVTYSQAGAVSITPAVETDTAMTLSVAKTIAPAAETDQAQPLSVTKTIRVTFGIAAETDTATGVTYSQAGSLTISPVTEIDTAAALTVTKTILKSLVVATETDLAQPLNKLKARTVAATVEVDTAQPVTLRKHATLGQAFETDQAIQLSVSGVPQLLTLAVAIEQDAALVLGWAPIAHRIDHGPRAVALIAHKQTVGGTEGNGASSGGETQQQLAGSID